MTIFDENTIQVAWQEYRSRQVMRVLKNGKWSIYPLSPGAKFDGVKAQIVPLHKVMSFPLFLRRNYAGRPKA